MQKQKTFHKLQEAQALLANFYLKSKVQRVSEPETEQQRVSAKYERRNFYEKRTHHPDGPGGGYEGL